MRKREFKGYPTIYSYILSQIICGKSKKDIIRELVSEGFTVKKARKYVFSYLNIYRKTLNRIYNK